MDLKIILARYEVGLRLMNNLNWSKIENIRSKTDNF